MKITIEAETFEEIYHISLFCQNLNSHNLREDYKIELQNDNTKYAEFCKNIWNDFLWHIDLQLSPIPNWAKNIIDIWIINAKTF